MHKMIRFPLTILALSLVTLLGAASAHADSTCTAMLAPHFNWAASSYGKGLHVLGSSVQKDHYWASYTGGNLMYQPSVDRFVGTLGTTFNDRTKWIKDPDCTSTEWPGLCYFWQPFWDKAADQTSFEIARDGTVYARSITWGGGTVTLPATCRESFLTFFDGWSLSVFNFQRMSLPG
jgi:hypothetical protein